MKRRRDVEMDEAPAILQEQFSVLGLPDPGMHVPPPQSRFSTLDISPWTAIAFSFPVADAQLRTVLREEAQLTSHKPIVHAAWVESPASIVAFTRANQLNQAIAHAREQKRQYLATLENLARYLMTKRPAEGIDGAIMTIQQTLDEIEPVVLVAGYAKAFWT